MANRAPRPDAPHPQALVPGQRWRRAFPGEERQLATLRRWLSSLLPECPARDDVLSVATELGSNAIGHTASGRTGGWFAVEVTWHESVMQVAVADCGGPAEPRVIDDPDAERGRGLLLVHGLSVRTGFAGDERGRTAWAQIAWPQGCAAGGRQLGQALCRGQASAGEHTASGVNEAIISAFDLRDQYEAQFSGAAEAAPYPALPAAQRLAGGLAR